MEENKNDVLFGTAAFGGFNRKNVMNYIDELQTKLADAKAQIRSLTAKPEQLAGTQSDKKEISEPPSEECSEAKDAFTEAAELLEQITQLKAQLRVERAENELLRAKMQGQNLEESAPRKGSLSLDDVDTMVQKSIR